ARIVWIDGCRAVRRRRDYHTDANRAHSGSWKGLQAMIVDSQVHLWKAETPDWRWVPGRVAQLPEPFTIEKLVPLMDEAGVDRAGVVAPPRPGGRNGYGREAAKRGAGPFSGLGPRPVGKPGGARPAAER